MSFHFPGPFSSKIPRFPPIFPQFPDSSKQISGNLHRIQALDTVLPRETSPDSPVYWGIDKEMQRFLEDVENSVNSCAVKRYFLSKSRKKLNNSEIIDRKVEKIRYKSEKAMKIRGKVGSSGVKLPGLPGYRVFHKRYVSVSPVFR